MKGRQERDDDNVLALLDGVRATLAPSRTTHGPARTQRPATRSVPHLTTTEEVLYTVLVRAGGRCVSPSELVLWIGYDYPTDRARDSVSIRAHISNLRAKLSWEEAGRIGTWRNHGYYYGELVLPEAPPPRDRAAELVEAAPAAWDWVEAQRQEVAG